MAGVELTLTFPDAHILRAKLTQTNTPGSWEAHIIGDIDRAIAEATETLARKLEESRA